MSRKKKKVKLPTGKELKRFKELMGAGYLKASTFDTSDDRIRQARDSKYSW